MIEMGDPLGRQHKIKRVPNGRINAEKERESQQPPRGKQNQHYPRRGGGTIRVASTPAPNQIHFATSPLSFPFFRGISVRSETLTHPNESRLR